MAVFEGGVDDAARLQGGRHFTNDFRQLRLPQVQDGRAGPYAVVDAARVQVLEQRLSDPDAGVGRGVGAELRGAVHGVDLVTFFQEVFRVPPGAAAEVQNIRPLLQLTQEFVLGFRKSGVDCVRDEIVRVLIVIIQCFRVCHMCSLQWVGVRYYLFQYTRFGRSFQHIIVNFGLG